MHLKLLYTRLDEFLCLSFSLFASRSDLTKKVRFSPVGLNFSFPFFRGYDRKIAAITVVPIWISFLNHFLFSHFLIIISRIVNIILSCFLSTLEFTLHCLKKYSDFSYHKCVYIIICIESNQNLQ